MRTLLTLLFLLPALVTHAQTLRVHGSDLMDDALKDVFAAYQARHPDVRIETRMEGSFSAREALAAGGADVAILAMPEGADPLPSEYESALFCFDIICIVVNAENPLKEMTLPTAASIFGAREAKSVSRWGELGLTGSWDSRTIAMHLPDSNSGISRAMFDSIVLDGRPLKPSISQWGSRDQLLGLVEQDGGAIAVVPGQVARTSVRALFIAKDEGGYAYPPAEDSIFFGDYPLRLPYVVAFRKDGPEAARNLAAYLLEDESAAKLRDKQLVPVPQSERQVRMLQLRADN